MTAVSRPPPPAATAATFHSAWAGKESLSPGPPRAPVTPTPQVRRAGPHRVSPLRATIPGAEGGGGESWKWSGGAVAIARGVRKFAAGVAVSAAVLGSGACLAEDLEIRYPSSARREIAEVQASMVEMWGWATQAYVDPTYNGLGPEGWKSALEAGLAETYNAPNGAEARAKMQPLLDKLGDPFTRVLGPDAAASYMRQERGAVVGVG
eukprot:CAMPEP_0182872424 /NCGR_PEP_ID=MMETSP0034_2-20130328/11696_1 /TAXON_ID=156128 /ORGANISM="Nephroselmis pyriformis, Strain CCMP717" /LENGTH=207 /DNA_ID=CAMNT_0025005015 /DNA_START=14 /DNA_END=633 /DNA_ORIENTATION=-